MLSWCNGGSVLVLGSMISVGVLGISVWSVGVMRVTFDGGQNKGDL